MTVASLFDLVSEKWIPCVRLDGSADELGLLDTLMQAHELREVVDASPLVTASLHRLLLAVLHRNFGPRNYDAWRKLWEAGRLDAEALGAYFDKWRHRFDLFDEERPFYQTPGMDEKMLRGARKLAEDASAGNNPTLFDHTSDDGGVALDAGEAARLIVAQQAYSLGGLMSDEGGRAYGKSACLTDGAAFLLSGETLAQTLLLNMVRYDPDADLPMPGDSSEDLPAWERPDAPSTRERMPDGYVDYLTWQPRRLYLQPETDPQGRLIVAQCIIADGERFPDDYTPPDPMMAYFTRDEKTEPRARRFGLGETLWRDSFSLLGGMLGRRELPRVAAERADLVIDGTIPREAVYDMDVLGLGSSKAKVCLWRHERLPLPLRYLADDELVDYLRECVELTEKVHGSLYGAACELAEEALTAGGRSADTNTRDQLIASLGVSAGYWAALELPFRELVVALAEEDGDRYALEAGWAERLRDTAWEVFARAERSLAPNARNLRAISHGRRVLGGSLRKHLDSYEEVTASDAD